MNLANIEHWDRLLSTNWIVSDSQMRSNCDSLSLSVLFYGVMLPQEMPINSVIYKTLVKEELQTELYKLEGRGLAMEILSVPSVLKYANCFEKANDVLEWLAHLQCK